MFNAIMATDFSSWDWQSIAAVMNYLLQLILAGLGIMVLMVLSERHQDNEVLKRCFKFLGVFAIPLAAFGGVATYMASHNPPQAPIPVNVTVSQTTGGDAFASEIKTNFDGKIDLDYEPITNSIRLMFFGGNRNVVTESIGAEGFHIEGKAIIFDKGGTYAQLTNCSVRVDYFRKSEPEVIQNK
jgi:hypothetical protein